MLICAYSYVYVRISVKYSICNSLLTTVFSTLESVGINHRGVYVGVPEQLLCLFYRSTVQQIECCRRMPQAVS